MRKNMVSMLLTAALFGTSFSGAAVSVSAAEAVSAEVIEEAIPVQAEIIPEEEIPVRVEEITEEAPVQYEVIPEEVIPVTVSETGQDVIQEEAAPDPITITVGDIDLPESGELYAGYAARLFYEELDTSAFPVYNVSRRTYLSGSALKVYDNVKTLTSRVASGAADTATVTMSISQLGLPAQCSFQELGLAANIDPNTAAGDKAIQDKVFEKIGAGNAMDSLIADLPYELYWFDKVIGYSISTSGIYWYGTTVYFGGNLTISMNVLAEYSASGNRGTFAVDRGKTGAAASAKTRAQQIVRENASKTDLQKMTAYRDAICDAVTYNTAAAGSGSTAYGDPWQLIYVFDGDTSTNVVCEGYSKAFQYLCDLSTFRDYRTTCLTVTGRMNGGNHMWNIVQMDNGFRYIADITNSDGSDRNRLFLKGAPDGSASGYTISSVSYTYDTDTTALFTSRERRLSTGASYAADLKTGDEDADGAWIKDKKGWWFKHVDGSYSRNQWEKINGKWYRFDASGYMQTGWVKSGGKWYYLDKNSGAMQTGWIKLSGKWYYLAPGGAMQTGWVKTGGKWYYMNSSGVMQTGWIKLSGKWYYLASGGAMQTGWLQLGSVWYYMNTSGVMQTGTVRIGGKIHYFTTSGVWVKGVSVPDKLIDVTTFGAIPNDTKSDEVSIKNAINAVGTGAYQDYGGVYIPSGTYKINIDSRYDGVWAQSNTVIVMEDDTILEALPSAIDNYYVFCVKWRENVTIIGGQIIGDRKIHKGTGGESGHGLFIGASTNVNVIGTKVSNCWGDGIYLGISSTGDSACDRINLTGCTISNNRRNNISVVEAHNVTIDHCTISNAYGTAPQCGICVEPNRNAAGKFVPNRNLTIKNTTVTQNKSGVAAYQHFAFMTVDFDNNTDVAATPVTVSNCTFKGDFANFSGKNMTIRNTKVTGTLTYKYDTTMSGVTYGKLQRWWI